MLKHELNGNILHVIETLHGFPDALVNHWYYDIEEWYTSSHGMLGDKPDRPMDFGAIRWVVEHHIPKVLPERVIRFVCADHGEYHGSMTADLASQFCPTCGAQVAPVTIKE